MIAHVGRPKNVVPLPLPEEWKAKVRAALELLAEQGITNEEVAKRAGISKGLLSKMTRAGGEMFQSAKAMRLAEEVAVPLPDAPLTPEDKSDLEVVRELRMLSRPAYENFMRAARSSTSKIRKETRRRPRIPPLP